MTKIFDQSVVFTQLHKSNNDNIYEIVIPVRNESFRLKYLIEGLKDNFKLVFLDGGSTDNTVDLIKSYDCDVYQRNDPKIYGKQDNQLAQDIFDAQNGTSWCIAYYINNVSKAKFIIRLWADEYINKNDQRRILDYFNSDRVNVVGRRVDWLYGYRIGSPTSCIISYCPGEAVWDDKILHSDVVSLSNDSHLLHVQVEHFSVGDTLQNIGKLAKYTKAEVSRITGNRKKYSPVFYRYGLMLFAPIKHFRKYTNFKLFLIGFLLQLLDCVVGHIIFFEMYYLNDHEKQNEIYQSYTENN